MNAALKQANREIQALFVEGNEEKIMGDIEIARKVYLFKKEESEKFAKARNLKKLKEYGDSLVKPTPKLIDNNKPNSSSKTAKKPQTKDDRLAEKLAGLGLGDPGEFLKRLKEGDTK